MSIVIHSDVSSNVVHSLIHSIQKCFFVCAKKSCKNDERERERERSRLRLNVTGILIISLSLSLSLSLSSVEIDLSVMLVVNSKSGFLLDNSLITVRTVLS